jgi:HAD superfamily hydrolase (TIGR01509 family)
MIYKKIDAIFLDHGNTMRVVVEDEAFQSHARQQLVELTGAPESPDVFCKQLEERYDAYKKRAKETLLQDSATEIWTRWMLPDYPTNKIAPLANQLTCLWRDHKGRHVLRPGAMQTIIELHRRDYILGIIANSISETEIPDWLEADGLTRYFKSVVLSSKFGRRKPDPYIYLEAAYLAGVKPEYCAYVGDNPNRDIAGAQRAGFGVTIILLEPDTLAKESQKSDFQPDVVIQKFDELLKVFPQR